MHGLTGWLCCVGNGGEGCSEDGYTSRLPSPVPPPGLAQAAHRTHEPGACACGLQTCSRYCPAPSELLPSPSSWVCGAPDHGDGNGQFDLPIFHPSPTPVHLARSIHRQVATRHLDTHNTSKDMPLYREKERSLLLRLRACHVVLLSYSITTTTRSPVHHRLRTTTTTCLPRLRSVPPACGASP